MAGSTDRLPVSREMGSQVGRPVTPNDTSDLPDGRCRGLYIGVSGDVVMISRGQQVTRVGMVAGIVHPISCDRVMATGTTATNIIAEY